MNKFDRIRDWKEFSKRMEEYIASGTQKKYGSKMQFNDLCHYTGLRVMVWNMLKYPLRLWTISGKRNDFEKTAHYSQMAWTLKERQGRKAPFFKEDIEGDYVVPDIEGAILNKHKMDHYYEVPEGEAELERSPNTSFDNYKDALVANKGVH